MEDQIQFSGWIHFDTRRLCEKRLRKAKEENPGITKVFCHISDRAVEYSGTMFAYMSDGTEAAAHTIAENPLDVIDGLLLSVRRQTREKAPAINHVPKTPLILIVDDDWDAIALMQSVLGSLGMGSTYAQNPFLAIDMMVHRKYELVVMDLQMPSLNGFQVLAHADAQLCERGFMPDERKTQFVTYSADTLGAEGTDPLYRQFKYAGHWGKNHRYQDLVQLASQTLSAA